MNTALRVSDRVITGDQARLFHIDRAIDRPAAVRVYVGEFFETAAAALFGGYRHQIDSTAGICPDLSIGRNRFLEIKSIGQNRQGLVYKHRLENDRRLVRETGGSLVYVFWIHNVEATAYRSLDELRAALAKGVEEVLCVPLERLWGACRTLRVQVFNYRTGRNGGPDEPMEGYRLPWRLLQRLAGHPTRNAWSAPDIRAHGQAISGLTVRGGNLGRCLPVLTKEERATAKWMAHQLRHEGLDVALAPAPRPSHRGHMIRVVQSRNPDWYRDLCSTCTRRRKKARARLDDTGIERPRVLRSLDRITAGELRYRSDFTLLPYVRSQIAEAE